MVLEKEIKQHYITMLKLAYTYVKSKQIAEDIVQDVCIKAFEKQHQFRQEASYKTYLLKMTINRSHDVLRSWSYRNHLLTNTFQQLFTRESAEKGMLIKDQRRKLALEVLKLKPKYREVIVLYYYEDLAVAEIADLLSCSENTVKTRMSRARAQLKEQIGDMEVSFYEEAIER